MSYQVLSRKWRPSKFSEVIGQDHITRSLQNALSRKRVGHAYLLTGTRGIGKTSVARLFAKALRCENLTADSNPCNSCNGCKDFDSGSSLNVFEIDGASNNSVDDIRELVQTVRGLPSFGEYKVYIIDEVHMLSTSAFNALLKTLEEPPKHVVFIFATTEPHKLLSTVLSRCLRFDFRNASVETLFKHAKSICEKENVEIERDSLLEGICEMGEGSFRDTLSLLDQVLSFSLTGKIDEASVATALGIAKEGTIHSILDALYSGNIETVQSTYFSLLSENIAVENICRDLLNQMYKRLLAEDSKNPNAELFWIYETMSKEFQWALENSYAEKVVMIVLKKIVLRREFFNTQHEAPEKKTVQSDEPVISEPEPIVEKKVLSYRDFLNFVKERSPGLYTNLEHGNSTDKTLVTEENVYFEIGFPKESKVFFDYLDEKDSRSKLSQLLSEYVEDENIENKINVVSLVREDESEFKTVAEVEEDKRLTIEKEKKEKIASHSMIKHAQKIFDTKIENIKLKE